MTSGRVQLAEWIARRLVNQREAADLLGVDKSSLNHLLTGTRDPGLKVAIRVERATGISVESWLPSAQDAIANEPLGPDAKSLDSQDDNAHAAR